jgi:hypothetical protein
MWLTSSALAIVLAVAAIPRGWTALFDAASRCFYAVPPDWKIDASRESQTPFAASPDGRVSATLIWSAQPRSHHVAALRALAQPKIVHEDTRERVWMEIDSPPPADVLHIAIAPSAVGACIVEITVSGESRDESRRAIPIIIRTLTSVH